MVKQFTADDWDKVNIRNVDRSAKSSDPMERALAGSVYRMRAEFHFENKEMEQGIELMKSAGRAQYDDQKAYNNLASVAAEYGQRELAAEFFKKAIEIWPEYITPYINLAALSLEKKDYSNAEHYLAQAEEIKKDDPRIEKLRRKLRPEKINLPQEIAVQLDNLQKNPNDPVAHFNTGVAYARHKMFIEAVKYWQKAIKLDDSYALPHKYLAIMFSKDLVNPEQAEYHKLEYQRLTGKTLKLPNISRNMNPQPPNPNINPMQDPFAPMHPQPSIPHAPNPIPSAQTHPGPSVPNVPLPPNPNVPNHP